MSAFLAGFVGVVVGSALSLLGVLLTLRKQAERDAKDDERRLRDKKHDRLRDTYREVLEAADAHVDGVWRLALGFNEAQRQGLLEDFMGNLLDDRLRIQEIHAKLRLEADQDRAVVDLLDDLDKERSTFLMAGIDRPDEMPFEEFEQGVIALKKKTEELVKLARTRLTELERPLP